MELVLLFGLMAVDGDVVATVHLLPDVIIHLIGNVGFFEDLDMESKDPLGGTVEIFTQFF